MKFPEFKSQLFHLFIKFTKIVIVQNGRSWPKLCWNDYYKFICSSYYFRRWKLPLTKCLSSHLIRAIRFCTFSSSGFTTRKVASSSTLTHRSYREARPGQASSRLSGNTYRRWLFLMDRTISTATPLTFICRIWRIHEKQVSNYSI